MTDIARQVWMDHARRDPRTPLALATVRNIADDYFVAIVNDACETDRAARALYARSGATAPWDSLSYAARREYHAEVRAVLVALISRETATIEPAGGNRYTLTRHLPDGSAETMPCIAANPYAAAEIALATWPNVEVRA